MNRKRLILSRIFRSITIIPVSICIFCIIVLFISVVPVVWVGRGCYLYYGGYENWEWKTMQEIADLMDIKLPWVQKIGVIQTYYFGETFLNEH